MSKGARGLQLLNEGKMTIPRNGATVSIIVLDQSSSMNEFGTAPEEAAMAHIRKLQNTEDGKEHFVAVIGFSSQPILCLPLKNVREINTIDRLIPGGMTLLYKTVFAVLDDLYEIVKRLTFEDRDKVKVVIAVMSDGQDNKSDPRKYPAKLRRFVQFKCPRVWDLLTFGFGISGKDIATAMGFPTDDNHAFDLEAGREDFMEASNIVSEHTTLMS